MVETDRHGMRIGLAGALIGALAGAVLCGPRCSAQEPAQFDVEAPEMVGGPWLNTPDHKPIKLASRRGKVTIIEFWTFG